MIGIQYRDEEDQTMRKMINYYSRELKLIETIKGINSKVDLFAKKFDYIIASEECIDEKYREIKYYSATINEKDIDTKINKTEKEEGCAGMV